jgi:hypothetical protein
MAHRLRQAGVWLELDTDHIVVRNPFRTWTPGTVARTEKSAPQCAEAGHCHPPLTGSDGAATAMTGVR